MTQAEINHDNDPSLQTRVHRSLDNAANGGWLKFLNSDPDRQLAIDLAYCDADLENEAIEDIVPHVASWRALNAERLK